jgi:putative ABC transport system permease protein
MREYAMLDALGVPRWRLLVLVLSQSCWIGLAGVILALPVSFLLRWAALLFHTRVILPANLLLIVAGLTVVMTVLSGLLALRALRHVETAALLR